MPGQLQIEAAIILTAQTVLIMTIYCTYCINFCTNQIPMVGEVCIPNLKKIE